MDEESRYSGKLGGLRERADTIVSQWKFSVWDLICMCVCDVYVYMYLWVCANVLIHPCMEPEVEVEWPSTIIVIHLILETGSLTEPGAHRFGWAAWSVSRAPPASTSPVSRCSHCYWLHVGAGNPYVVLMLSWWHVFIDGAVFPTPALMIQTSS